MIILPENDSLFLTTDLKAHQSTPIVYDWRKYICLYWTLMEQQILCEMFHWSLV